MFYCIAAETSSLCRPAACGMMEPTKHPICTAERSGGHVQFHQDRHRHFLCRDGHLRHLQTENSLGLVRQHEAQGARDLAAVDRRGGAGGGRVRAALRSLCGDAAGHVRAACGDGPYVGLHPGALRALAARAQGRPRRRMIFPGGWIDKPPGFAL